MERQRAVGRGPAGDRPAGRRAVQQLARGTSQHGRGDYDPHFGPGVEDKRLVTRIYTCDIHKSINANLDFHYKCELTLSRNCDCGVDDDGGEEGESMKGFGATAPVQRSSSLLWRP